MDDDLLAHQVWVCVHCGAINPSRSGPSCAHYQVAFFQHLDGEARDGRVLHAMRAIDRASFLPPEARMAVYLDEPVDIGLGQTCSQPSMVLEETFSKRANCICVRSKRRRSAWICC